MAFEEVSFQYVGVDDDGDGDGDGGGDDDDDDDDTRGRTDDAKDEIKSVLFHGLYIPNSKFFNTPRIHYT